MPVPISLRRQWLPFAVAAVVATVALLLPMPVSFSVVGTRLLSSFGAGIPEVDRVSELGLILLAAATVAGVIFAWRRRPEARTRVGAGVVGVVLAYGTSELAKLLFMQPRPCSRWQTAAVCPPAGDWSLPSNHATLAFGAAVVIAVAVGRSRATVAALALAAVVAIGRVVQGVHYVHDVALGAIVGLVVTIVAVVLVGRWEDRRRRARQ